MRRAVLLAALALLAGCERAPQVTFADAAITLPEDPAVLPDLPGREAVIAHCTACHSPSMMLQQPEIPRKKWESIVAKMAEVYKAPIDQRAVPEIVDYLIAAQDAQASRKAGSR
ncbi:MAG: cytochrome c [Erythrobacter sp.]